MARLYLRGGVWHADLRSKGGGRRSTGMTDEASAHAVLARMMVECDQVRAGLRLPVEAAPSVPRALDTREGVLRSQGRDEAYIARARAYAERLVKVRRLSDLTPAMVERGLLAIRARRSPSTANNARSAVKSFMECCVRYGWLSDNPVKLPIFPNKASKRRRALTLAELGKLLTCEAIPAERRRVYGILVYSGLRAGELDRLTWGNLDEQRINIPASIAKSGRDETIPIGQSLSHYLGGQRGSMRLCDSVPDSRRFRADLRLAGIQREDRMGRVAVVHSLRHGFRSLLGSIGATDAQSKALMRHSMGDVTDRYLDANLLELRSVVDKLPMVG